MVRILSISFFLFVAGAAAAQSVEVTGTVSATAVGRDDLIVFSVQVKGASLSSVTTPAPPTTEGLALIQRVPSTHRNMTIINGELEESVGYRWTFRPIAEGDARIDATQVVVDGQTYSTRPIAIRVLAQSQAPPQARRRQQLPLVLPGQPQTDESQEIATQDLFIRAIPSKRTAFQNEQVTIEYQLFFRDGIQLRHSRLAGSWDAEGFWREEFEVDTRPIPRSVVENGLLYHVIVLKRVAVFPTRSGTLTVDPLKIETEAYLPVGGSDPFERFFSLRNRFETVEVTSDPVRIEVASLPSGAPASFDGAVGEYRMDASLDATDVQVGEPVHLSVSVLGTGNLATLESPLFVPPGVFEKYDPDVSTDIQRTGETISGKKTFTYVVVPRSNGEFDLPPIEFVYYDPREQRYVSVERELGTVRVTGTAAPLAAGTTSNGLPVDDIASILSSTDSWRDTSTPPLHRSPLPYVALIVPAALLLLMQVRQRHVERIAGDTRYARSRMAHPLAKKHLRRAEQLLKKGDPRAFYEEIERAVTGFIGNRLNISELGLTRSQIDSRLDDAGVAEPIRASLRVLLEECDLARFAPVLPDRQTMESASERAAHVIVGVEEAVQSRLSATA
ncbi:MAG: BatD family protein [Rhodothermales bacterium]